METLKEITFKLNSEYIELIKLLKVTRVCGSGGEAKMIVEQGLVKYNGQVDTRKRLKVRVGDVIDLEIYRIIIQ